ncbi:MAG: hypothetical protein ACF8PN_08140 [Phycisphaerales bacterium]
MSMYDPPITAQPEPTDRDDSGGMLHRVVDFRGGIFDSLALQRPPGQAQREGTFQCMTDDAGALVPAPRLAATITRDPADLGSPTLLNEQFRISGIYGNAPVYSFTDPDDYNTTGPDENHTEIFMALEWWTSPGDLHLEVARYRRNLETPVWEQVWTRNYPTGTYDVRTRPRNCVFFSQLSNPSDPLSGGPRVVAWVFSANARVFPDPANPTVSATVPLPADAVGDPQPFVDPTWGLGHQGRFVILPLYVTGDGSNGQVYVSSETGYWTPPNDHSQRDPNLSLWFNILGGYEEGSGYGALASLTADELFLVKLRGGAIFIAGDLNSPDEVRTLPYVRSTGMSLCDGTRCYLGYAYPVDSSGVWLWSGGDTSEHVTKHLNGEFWRPTPVAPAYPPEGEDPSATGWGHGNTQATWWNEFSLFPNNWMWDTDHRGWWRLLDPDFIEVHKWTSDERGRLAWGAPSGFTTVTDPVAYEFSRDAGATLWQWRSHPLTHTVDREYRVTDVIISGYGKGKVAVAFEDPNTRAEIGEVVVEFDDDERIQKKRVETNAVGSSLIMRILSVGADHDESKGSIDLAATVDAPTVVSVDYRTTPANTFRSES